MAKDLEIAASHRMSRHLAVFNAVSVQSGVPNSSKQITTL
jgi:hypothetical protein